MTRGLSLGIDIGGTSIKGALLDGERCVWTGRSPAYARPDRETLLGALRAMLNGSPLLEGARAESIGVCAPGLRAPDGRIARAVNVPGLVGVMPRELAAEAMPPLAGVRAAECTDALAAGMDVWRARPGEGRLLALSLGTGVGACVLDTNAGGAPRTLIVTGRGPGQIGQMDVGEGPRAEQPIGPDGGRGTLEAYIGLPALRTRFGDDAGVELALREGRVRADGPPLSALVRALRIAHAIYLPERIALLGGVGVRLSPLGNELHAAVSDGLTPLARAGWTLEFGTDGHHAARGAAWIAALAE